MALATKKVFLENFNPLVQAKRYRGKINIQRPKPPHFERAKYIELTKPYFISPYKNKAPFEICQKPIENLKKEIDNPFQRIVAKELQDWFNKSKLIAFYHLNPMEANKRYKACVMFKKENMYFKNYGKKTMELAVKGTKFETVLDFYVSHNMTVFSPELELKQLLKITKKFRELVLLAAIVEGQLISKDEIIELSKIPNLQTAQANLVQTINSAASTLTSQLNSHQNTLVAQLQERIKQLEEKKS